MCARNDKYVHLVASDRMTVDIDDDRLLETFEEYSTIGATENNGLHRLALSNVDKKVRDRFVSDLEVLGLDVHIDELGNIFGRREGIDSDAAPVLIGSHLDSQPNGGRFDGQLGVLTALETLHAFEDEDIGTERPIEIVNWTNEEGSRFEKAMLGSGSFAGAVDVDEALALTDADGHTVEEELARIGYDGNHSCEPRDLHAYLELHIEQGPHLEENDRSIGIVEGVVGESWMEATVHGESDHAGPTPMHARCDALVTATSAIKEIQTLPNRLSTDAVSTVGRMNVSPGSVNVVPDEVTFTIDVRSYDDNTVGQAVEATEFELDTACKRTGASYELESLWSISSLEFSPMVRDQVEANATSLDISYQHIVSGAGHDASYINEVTDSGLVFVPSVDGKTHNEAEYTRSQDILNGARVYANTALALANDV